MKEKSERKYKSTALDKAFGILSLLADQTEGLTLSETARALDTTVGKIYRILVSLADSGFIKRDVATEKYQLTVKLLEISLRHSSTNKLVQTAQPRLQRLAAETLHSCHLGVRFSRELLIVAKAESPVSPHFSVNVGAMFPLHETTSGVVLLADEPPDEIAQYKSNAPDWNIKEFEERRKSLVKNGFASWPSDILPGVLNMSFPIRDYTNRTIAALTIPYMPTKRVRMSPEMVQAHLGTVADDISVSLGYMTPAAEDAVAK